MAKRTSGHTRTTLYRLDAISVLSDALREKYLDQGFTLTETTVGGREAILMFGAMSREKVAWAETLQALAAIDVGLGNHTAAAALIIRRGEDGAWALTYGMGFQLLDQEKVDGGFGQRIALRVADPDELNSITRTTLDQRARIDRFSIPGGDHLRGFGVGDFGELVTRLVAKAEIPSLTAGGRASTIRGADALNLPLGTKPATLLADLDQLEVILSQPAAVELEMLEQLVAVKHRPELTTRLEEELDTALANAQSARLGLSWPHERIDENGSPATYRISGAGRLHSAVRDGTPQLATLAAVLAASEDPSAQLKKLKIQLFRDNEGHDPISTEIPGRRWFSFETEIDGCRYCLHDGSWFLMDQRYAADLKARTQKLFERTSPVILPEWPSGMDEAAYNQLVTDDLGGTLMDKKLIRTALHRHGIEACDILAPGGELIHVKSIESSAPASHLLAQALVSADALSYDEEAREELRKRVRVSGGNPDQVRAPIRTLVLGIARKDRIITCDDLFTFTQVTLVRAAAQLQGRGLQVYVVPVVRHA